MKQKRIAVSIIVAVIMLLSVSCGSQAIRNKTEAPGIQGNTQNNAVISAKDLSNGVKQNESRDQQNGEEATQLYPAQVSYLSDRKWGYINTAGRFMLTPVFTQASMFQSNGLAVAGTGEKVGLINKAGKYVVEPFYLNIRDFHEGLAIAQNESGFLVIDENGKVLSEVFPYIDDYHSSRAAYYIQRQNGTILYGYLDETGHTVIEPSYEYAGEFEKDRAVVRYPGNSYVLIGKDGAVLKKLEYRFVMDISDGMIAFTAEQGGKYGYLNSKGEVAIAPAFLSVQDFTDGMAVVNASDSYAVNRFALIDKKGRFLIKPQYNDILQLGDGLAAIGVANDADNIFAGSRYALAAQDGSILTDFVFYGMERFKNGVASVYDRTNTFFIDKTGRKVETLPAVEGTGVLELFDSLVYADIDKRPYYMNRQGGTVYRPSAAIILKSGIKVSEAKFKPNRDYIVYYPVLGGMESLKIEEMVNGRLRSMWTDSSIKPADNLDYHYEGNFNIGLNKKNLLVLRESGYDYPFGAAHGMPIMEYVHVDTKTGVFYQLEDLFKDGSNYTEVLSGIVEEQIKEKGDEMGIWPDNYKGIKPDQPFYLTEDALMLYFYPYEIAPYAAGFPMFSVPYPEISEIIDKKGSFWLSFH